MHPPKAHGGDLRLLIDSPETREQLIRETAQFAAHTLSPEQLSQLEALMSGIYSPLEGFMDETTYNEVLQHHRLTSGVPWPIPVTLEVPEEVMAEVGDGSQLLLRDEEGTPLALLTVSSRFRPAKDAEAIALYGTKDLGHPAVGALLATRGLYVGGRIQGIQFPKHYDFTELRTYPEQVRQRLSERALLGFAQVLPAYGGLSDALVEVAREKDMDLLLGIPSGSDLNEPVPYAVRARQAGSFSCRLGSAGVTTCLMPMTRLAQAHQDLAARVITLRNYGCSAVAVEEGAESAEGLALAQKIADASGIELVLLKAQDSLQDSTPLTEGGAMNSHLLFTSLRAGKEMADVIHPDDLAVLRKAFPPRKEQGLVLFFTGLSGAGKSTVAKALTAALGAYDRPVTLLDGDVVRLNLSKGLGFSKGDRDTNILRIGYVASLVAKSGGLAICAPIAPYRKTRGEVRRMVGSNGRFVEVHVATDLATCESRDPKGLYARARAGQIKGFTGIDDPYEAPENPELRLDTGKLSVSESIETVVSWLSKNGYL